jgi:hypothetical protein
MLEKPVIDEFLCSAADILSRVPDVPTVSHLFRRSGVFFTDVFKDSFVSQHHPLAGTSHISILISSGIVTTGRYFIWSSTT